MNNLRNKNLKTVNTLVSSQTSAITIGGVVPAGMNRWVTFMMVDCVDEAITTDLVLHVASVSVSNPTMASLIATGNTKWQTGWVAVSMSQSNQLLPLKNPKSGPNGMPIFSIGSGSWLGVFASLTSAHLFTQFYDE